MKVRKMSIFSQLFIWLAVLLLLGNGVLGVFAYNRAESALFEQIQESTMNLASCAAANVQGDVLQGIQPGDEGSEAYETVIDQLALFRDNSNLEYIYTLRWNGSEFEFVVDSDTEEPADIGEICETTDAMALALEQSITTADDEPFTDEWGTHISAYSPIFFEDEIVGFVGIDINADWIGEQMSVLRNLVLIIAVATYGVSLVCLWLLMLKFKRSMSKLNDKVKELASGSGDLTREIEIRTGDELELIADNMNAFICQIRSLVKDVAVSTGEILVTGEELSATVSENVRIMADMNAKIEDINANMQESSVSSQQLSENLSQSADEVAAFAQNVDGIRVMVQQANEHAQTASTTVKANRSNALTAIRELQERMETISAEVQKIEQVKQIAEEISSIAGQTSMLSLNAQIEAARAGAMGAGFAVVATQVGRLSVDINRAVTEINKINNQVLSAVGALTEVSDEMIRFVSEDVVKDYDAFTEIGEEYGTTTEAIRSQMAEIAEQSVTISHNIAEINDKVQNITSMVSMTTESATQLADATSRVTESMEELDSASQKNSQHSESLNGQVSKYTY